MNKYTLGQFLHMNRKLYLGIISVLVLVVVACTPTATVEFDADTAVPLSLVTDLQFSDTSDLSIPDCVQRFEDINTPSTVTEGDVIPTDFVLYIDLDPVYIGWETLSLESLCVKSNWGVFRTTGTVEIPDVEASVWSIDMDA